jgi:hypothetical protein
VLASSILVGIFIAALVGMLLYLSYLKISVGSTDRSITDAKNEIGKYKEVEDLLVSLEKGLAGARQIIANDKNWTVLFPHIEQATPAEVVYTRLKLTPDQIDSDIEGASVDALARLVDGYKEYEVISVSGVAEPNKVVLITLDGGIGVEVKTKETGSYKYAFKFDSTVDHKIVIQRDGDQQEQSVNYTAATKELKADSGITAKTGKLFYDVEVKQYERKENNRIKFGAKYKFNKELVW